MGYKGEGRAGETGTERRLGTRKAAWEVQGERRKWIPREWGERKRRVRGGGDGDRERRKLERREGEGNC